jgi:hypothetical protein
MPSKEDSVQAKKKKARPAAKILGKAKHGYRVEKPRGHDLLQQQ